MVSFQCDQCQDVVKKPQLKKHASRCWQDSFTCIDCNTSFTKGEYASHTSCISEAQKYQKSLYKEKKGKSKPHGTPVTQSPSQQPIAKTPNDAVNPQEARPGTSANDSLQNGVEGASKPAKKKKRKRDSEVPIEASEMVTQDAMTKPESKKQRKSEAANDESLSAEIGSIIRSKLAVVGVSKSLQELCIIVQQELQASQPALSVEAVEKQMLHVIRIERGKKRPQLVLP